MILTQSIGEVLLVVFLHQALVINKENIGRHWNGCVAIVGGGSCVEKFEAFVALFRLRWLFLESKSEKTVQFTGGDGVLGKFTYFGNFAEYQSDGLFLQC